MPRPPMAGRSLAGEHRGPPGHDGTVRGGPRRDGSLKRPITRLTVAITDRHWALRGEAGGSLMRKLASAHPGSAGCAWQHAM